MHSSCGVLRQGIKNLLFVVESKNTSLFASSPILRRQQFLIRVLKGCESGRLMMSGTNVADALEVDAEEILRAITTPLDLDKHKGQAGRVAIIGGCREYTGAPYFAAISALKIGADLSHVFCTKDAAGVIKSYSPELIVHPLLEESYSVRDEEKAAVQKKVLEEVSKWIERFDCLVVGPGLGRDPFLMDCVAEIILIAREAKIPIVVDGDGLFLVTNKIQLVEGYPLAVLTPNVNEYKRLVEKVLGDENSAQVGPAKLKLLAERIGGLTIVQKGKADVISDGEVAVAISLFGSPRRCGGQGDILSGSIAVFSSWARRHVESAAGANDSFPKNPMVLGSIAGSVLLRKAALLAFSKRKRSTLTTDIIECIGESMEEISPSGY